MCGAGGSCSSKWGAGDSCVVGGCKPDRQLQDPQQLRLVLCEEEQQVQDEEQQVGDLGHHWGGQRLPGVDQEIPAVGGGSRPDSQRQDPQLLRVVLGEVYPNVHHGTGQRKRRKQVQQVQKDAEHEKVHDEDFGRGKRKKKLSSKLTGFSVNSSSDTPNKGANCKIKTFGGFSASDDSDFKENNEMPKKKKKRKKVSGTGRKACQKSEEPLQSAKEKNERANVRKDISNLDKLLEVPDKSLEEILDAQDEAILHQQQVSAKRLEVYDRDISLIKKAREEARARSTRNGAMRDILQAELSEDMLRKLFSNNKDYLAKVWRGETKTERYRQYYQGIKARRGLFYKMVTEPFSEDQLNWTLDEISKVWMKNEKEWMDNNDFVWKVLLPEAFIVFYSEFFGLDKKEAEMRISETPSNDQFSDDD